MVVKNKIDGVKVPDTDKETKKWFKKIASEDPDSFYPVAVLKERGFKRKSCSKCGTFFWTVNEDQEVCGDPNCRGGFTLSESSVDRDWDYIRVWQEFSKMFSKKGYAVIKRYPVVARWNPTMDFTIASIAAFQPYVVNGAVAPPAKELVIPQFCLRFGDVDNVGITMSHMTGFVMIGQHAFVNEEEWDQNRYFKDIFDWLTEGLGLPLEEITFHEDAWAGGGNFGPCMEYFSQGIELGNQVYMMFENHNGLAKPLSSRVLAMGMGHERTAWFIRGEGTIYDAAFPTVIDWLKKKTNIVVDEELLSRYIPYAPFLNLDEVDDIDEAWDRVSEKTGIPVTELKEKIEPLTALYSIAEHSRALLFAIVDGGLPSNVGGGYNLRSIFRRAQNFIDKYSWNFSIADVAVEHAKYLKPLFPELSDAIDDVKKILAVEERKYYDNKARSSQIIGKLLSNIRSLNVDKLISLYDTYGITPEQVKSAAKELLRKGLGKESGEGSGSLSADDIDWLSSMIPKNFFSLVAEAHERKSSKKPSTKSTKEYRFDLSGIPPTTPLYFDSYDYVDFEGEVVKVLKDIDGRHNLLVLNRTAFYPTSGGQEHDTGTITNPLTNKDYEVIDVFKQDGVIIHRLKEDLSEELDQWGPGVKVLGKVDFDRRLQLTQHHTATHIINAAARKVLGNHVWQGGASKSLEKARIDITHYDVLSPEEESMIEKEANKIVKADLPVFKALVPKNLAEAEYGFRLYQGGAVPGKEIRVVNIGGGLDVEACGGTHLNTTGEAEVIKIIKSSKVQDGLVRIEFVAGGAAKRLLAEESSLLSSLADELGVSPDKIPDAVDSLFLNWKRAKKAVKKGKDFLPEWDLGSFSSFEGDPLDEAARRLRTQKEHLLKSVKRFKNDILSWTGSSLF